jgi:hypothetical protein
MSKKIYALVLLIPILLVGGCTTPVAPDFLAMSKKYSNVLEQYQIDMIFTNVMRSSLDHPLSFLDMPNINGTGSITTMPSVSANFTGMGDGVYFASPISGALASVMPSLSMQIGNSFNFSLSSLDNSLFWKSFLDEIPLDYAKYFIHNHIPREVILSLVIDQIAVNYPDGKQKILINNPLRPEYPEFQKELYQLISYGLAVQPVFNITNQGLPMTKKELQKNYGANPRQFLAQSSLDFIKINTGSVDKYQVVKMAPVYKMCIKKNKFENFVKENYGSGIFCQDAISLEDTTKNTTNEPSVNIALRSVKNIYDFLGQVAAAQLNSPSYIPTVRPTDGTFLKKAGESNQFALLVVNRNSTDKAFTSMEALDDNYYSIPRENNGYSTLVINILSQLQTLSKSPGSIPSSPAVLIK